MLVLLDSASLYFRAFFGVPQTITAPDGTPVNAVRGFTEMVAYVIELAKPTRLVACLDLEWRPAFRARALPSYKAHRLAPDGKLEIVPPDLERQVPILLDVLRAAGIARAGADGYEADDVIGALCARERTDAVEVVSGDRDLFQVVRDEPTPVRVRYAGRGLARATLYGPAELAERYGLPAARAGAAYTDMAVLRGDPSDGLPGVPGIGEKTAAGVVSKFASFDELLAAVDDPRDRRLSGGIRTKLAAAREYLAVAPAVVRAAVDAPVALSDDDRLPPEPDDLEELAALGERWGIAGPVRRLTEAMLAAAR
ncbi:MAG TPA: 5'-3' exonuclease [Pseudonocardiaceae bacterium]|jgi:5'-3' exonuclease